MALDITDRKARIEKIKNGRGIQHIVDEASEILGNPIVLQDMEYVSVVMSPNPIDDDPFWNEYKEKGRLGPELLEFCKNELFLDAAANTQKITFLESDKLKYERIYGKVFAGENLQIGCAVLLACLQPLQDDCPELFEIVCDILTIELSASEAFHKYGQAYQDALITQLINGEITDRALYTAHVESLYIGLKSRIYLALISGRAHFDPENTQNLLLRKQPGYKYSVYGNYVVALISTDMDGPDDKDFLAPLVRIIKKKDLYIGISEYFDSLFELPTYFRQAETALCEGRNSTADGHMFVH